ncbi:MAG: SulP family inorganic anion transporter [Burkholderiaceae bacterium]|nr:SulP family inorganic anion transporter [Burkholderiaceae bacterium]
MPLVPALATQARRWLGDWVGEVDRRSLRDDGMAAFIGALIVLPQGIAFAALAGLPPTWGLYTSIVPCIVAALMGASRLMVSGPTNATSLALAAMLAPLAASNPSSYLQLALVATFALGVVQAVLGLVRLGVLANFVSPSVLLGFITGAAVLIAEHALRDLSVSGVEAGVGAITLAATLAAQRWVPGRQHMLIGLVTGGLAAWLLARQGWVAATVGQVAHNLPTLQAPSITLTDLRHVGGAALALAVVSLGQTMAVGKAIAGRRGELFDPNRECVAQGTSNIVGSFFSCFVSCGSLNRSVVNEQVGARSPLAGVFSALIVAALMLLGGPVLQFIPMAAIAATLLPVAWSLVDRSHWRRVIQLDRAEAVIAAGTAVATVLVSLQVAILGGMSAALIVYLYGSARPALRTMGFDKPASADHGHHGDRPFVVLDDAPPGAQPECPQLKLLRMEGSVYFGATAHVGDHLHRLRAEPNPQKHLLVMAKSMSAIDLAGADLWEAERVRRLALGGDLYFHRPRPQVMDMWRRSGFLDRLGADHIFARKPAALLTIVDRLDPEVCRQCHARIFVECAGRPGPDPKTDLSADPAPDSVIIPVTKGEPSCP